MSREIYKRIVTHIDRVRYDGGVIDVKDGLLLLQQSNERKKATLKVAFCPELYGNKIRTSGNINYLTKGYSKDDSANDLTQTSSANQPVLDKIAPIEKLGAKNPNGGSNYLTHPTITFGASDEWSVETMFVWNGGEPIRGGLYGSLINSCGIRINVLSNLGLIEHYGVGKSENNFNIGLKSKSGKYALLTVTYNKTNVYYYLNGILVYVLNNFNAGMNFDSLFFAIGEGYYLYGKVSSHHIFSKALSAYEVAERSAILRSIFPEIPFTRIGDQIWSVRNYEAVVTPQGNLIPEMQANGNVEKITNGGFDSSSNWYYTSNVSISSGVCNFNNASSSDEIHQDVITSGKWYKVTYTILNYVSGQFVCNLAGGMGTTRSSNGTFTEYILAKGGRAWFQSLVSGTTLQIDNVSIQEIGWSGSQELYDGIYAQTSGTVEQKTYAAVKAAAMWCHYNNDPAIGAIYGKLYNWFAVKLLQMDIDYYNAANPSTPWGWRVPTQSDFQTLSTYLGGDAVSGGKLKMNGTTYWNSPNTGADNSSGFSAIGVGGRIETGSFLFNLQYSVCHSLSEISNTISNRVDLAFNNSNISIGSTDKKWGCSLRLIKS